LYEDITYWAVIALLPLIVRELNPNVPKKTHHSSNGCHKDGKPSGEIAVYKGIGEIL